MHKENKNTRTPRLRFTEFRETGDWEEKKLENICLKNNIKFVHLHCDDLEQIDLARDLRHCGILSHKKLSEKFLQVIN